MATYNKQNYNRGKYNVSAGNQQVSGFVSLAVTPDYAVGNIIYDAPKTAADIAVHSIGRQTSEIFAAPTISEISTNAGGDGILGVFAACADDDTDIIFSAISEFSLGMFAPTAGTEMTVTAKGTAVRELFGAALDAGITTGTSGQSARVVFAKEMVAEVDINSNGAATWCISADVPTVAANINVSTTGSTALYGYSVLSLPGLVLPPNGEIVIDTEQMTVTLNGQDVTRYFSPESEFFKLKPGENRATAFTIQILTSKKMRDKIESVIMNDNKKTKRKPENGKGTEARQLRELHA